MAGLTGLQTVVSAIGPGEKTDEAAERSRQASHHPLRACAVWNRHARPRRAEPDAPRSASRAPGRAGQGVSWSLPRLGFSCEFPVVRTIHRRV